MLLYSYHIINVEDQEVSTDEYKAMTTEQQKSLRTQVKRHFATDVDRQDKPSIRVLSLVGGGIRGYMLGKTLEEIEQRTGKRIAQLFDCIIGTSTGVPIACALSYPEEVTVEAIIKNPELSTPHAASPKFSAATVTKIYSHYGAYIFAKPHLKRVLDPFIKGKCDGETYVTATEIDDQIEHEGAVIRMAASSIGSVQGITDTITEFRNKIELTKNLLNNLPMNNSMHSVINPATLLENAMFLKTFFCYPLRRKIHSALMAKLRTGISTNAALSATVDTAILSTDIFEQFNMLQMLMPPARIKEFIGECIRELQEYYLTPLNALQDGIAEYEKYTTTFFDKDGIKEVLKRFLPHNAKLEDFLGCTAGIACVRDNLELKIMDNLNPATRKISAYDAILASVSAQVFFQSQTIGDEALVDAGSAVKSPSQAGLVLASKYFPDNCSIEIFEIGTAKTPLFSVEHPQKLTRILDPSDSLYMAMDAGRNSTSAILRSLAGGDNSLLKYHEIDFDLGEDVYLENATSAYFDKMSAAVSSVVRDDSQDSAFESFITALHRSSLDADPIVSEEPSRYQWLYDLYAALLSEYDVQNALETRTIHMLNILKFRVTARQLQIANNFMDSYKKYSAIAYPIFPQPCYSAEASIDASGQQFIMTARATGTEVPILSIDGGGTRGIWPLKVLEYIEKSTGKAISDIFPIKGGTSVGGLISIILSIPGKDGKAFYKASDVANLLKDAEQIFPLGHYRKIRNLLDPEKGVMFDNAGLKKVLTGLIKKATGSDDLCMRDLIGDDVGVLSFENGRLKPIFFSKILSPGQSVIEAGICTASAPVYFPDNSVEIDGEIHKMGDGGVPDNNPVWYVYGMFNAAKKPHEVAKILSLGTGSYLADHPKQDAAPFWMSPAALLGFAMDSRTISQNTFMEIYSKTPASNISNFLRLQWDLPTSIDLTSSLPVTIPFDSVPECLPIGYSDENKIVDYNDLATIMAAKCMIESNFIDFIQSCTPIVDNYTPAVHFALMLGEQESKFKHTWAMRLAASIDMKMIVLDFLDPLIKQDIFRLVHRTCMGISLICEEDFKSRGIDLGIWFSRMDYAMLTVSIIKAATEMGMTEEGKIAGYVHKINILLNFLDDKRKTGILKFISDEILKIHKEGHYSQKPEMFLSHLIINLMQFMKNNPYLHEWVDYSEKQLYNPNFLHKLAALTQMMPRNLTEPVVYFAGAAGLKVVKAGAGILNAAYLAYTRQIPTAFGMRGGLESHSPVIEKDHAVMAMLGIVKERMGVTTLPNVRTMHLIDVPPIIKASAIDLGKQMLSTAINLPWIIKNSSISVGKNAMLLPSSIKNCSAILIAASSILTNSVRDYYHTSYRATGEMRAKIAICSNEEKTRKIDIANMENSIIGKLDEYKDPITFAAKLAFGKKPSAQDHHQTTSSRPAN